MTKNSKIFLYIFIKLISSNHEYLLSMENDAKVLDIAALKAEFTAELKLLKSLREKIEKNYDNLINQKNDESGIHVDIESYIPKEIFDINVKLPRELELIVNYLRFGSKLDDIQAIRGAILYGPPGSGKTHCIRAILAYAEWPVFELAGSSFVTSWQGSGSAIVKDVFLKAKNNNLPCAIFIDEIENMSLVRDKNSVHAREHNSALIQLLIELDNVKNNKNIIFFGATNRLGFVDPALLDRFSNFRIKFDKINSEQIKKFIFNYLEKKNINMPENDLAKIIAESIELDSFRAIEDALNTAYANVRFTASSLTAESIIEEIKSIKEKNNDYKKELQKTNIS